MLLEQERTEIWGFTKLGWECSDEWQRGVCLLNVYCISTFRGVVFCRTHENCFIGFVPGSYWLVRGRLCGEATPDCQMGFALGSLQWISLFSFSQIYLLIFLRLHLAVLKVPSRSIFRGCFRQCLGTMWCWGLNRGFLYACWNLSGHLPFFSLQI